MVKDVKYIYWVKKDLFGCFRIEEIRDNDNETSWKEGGVIEMSTTVLSIYAMHALFRFCIYLPAAAHKIMPTNNAALPSCCTSRINCENCMLWTNHQFNPLLKAPPLIFRNVIS